MRFKEFLLMEAGFSDSGSDWFFGNYLYPSDAFDWADTIPFPQDFVLLRNRWKKDREAGRKFHNIDVDGVLNTNFVSVSSNTMPDVSDGFWKHKPDTRPNLKIEKKKELDFLGVGKSASVSKVLTKSNNLIDKTAELDKMFGKIKSKYPEVSKDFDKPWKKKYERKTFND